MDMTVEMALNSYNSPIAKEFPYNKSIRRSESVKPSGDLATLALWVDSLALVPSQTMTRTIRMKKRIGTDNSQYVIRKDKVTKKDVIFDRHSQTDEKTELIPSYLVSYCQRKLTRLRQGKGKGKNIDFDSGCKESYNRKKDGKRMLRALPGRYLRGSQDHIRQSSIDDAMESVQTALMFWIEINQKTWLNRLDEPELLAYIRECKKANRSVMPCVSQMTDRKPLTYRILAIGCFRIMRDSFRWSRKVDSKVWDQRHGIQRIGDEPAKEMPPMIELPLKEVKDELETLPVDSRTQRATKNILILRIDGMKCKEIAQTLGYPIGYVKNCISRFRKANPYLCHKVLTPV